MISLESARKAESMLSLWRTHVALSGETELNSRIASKDEKQRKDEVCTQYYRGLKRTYCLLVRVVEKKQEELPL